MNQQPPMMPPMPPPPKPPLPFMPPLEPMQIQEAVEQAFERLGDLVKMAWDQGMKQSFGFYDLPAPEQWMVFQAREPLFLLTPEGVVMGPWLAELARISSVETAKLLTLYRRLQTLYEADIA